MKTKIVISLCSSFDRHNNDQTVAMPVGPVTLGGGSGFERKGPYPDLEHEDQEDEERDDSEEYNAL